MPLWLPSLGGRAAVICIAAESDVHRHARVWAGRGLPPPPLSRTPIGQRAHTPLLERAQCDLVPAGTPWDEKFVAFRFNLRMQEALVEDIDS